MISFGLLVSLLVTLIVVIWIFYVLASVERLATEVTETPLCLEEKEKEELPKEPKPEKDSRKCSFGFGYLKKHAKDLPYPDECLSCPRVLECKKEFAGEIQTRKTAVAQPEKKRDELELGHRELENKALSD